MRCWLVINGNSGDVMGEKLKNTEGKHDKRVLTYDEWQDEGERLFGDDRKQWKFRCPKCDTKQNFNDFVKFTELTPDDITKYIAFSCIGRFTDKMGCNWTLGGLFQMHTLEITDPEGNNHPMFEFAEQ